VVARQGEIALTHAQRDALIQSFGTNPSLGTKRPAALANEIAFSGLGCPSTQAVRNLKKYLVKKARQQNPEADESGQRTPANMRDTTDLKMWCDHRFLDMTAGVGVPINEQSDRVSVLYHHVQDQTITMVLTSIRFVTKLAEIVRDGGAHHVRDGFVGMTNCKHNIVWQGLSCGMFGIVLFRRNPSNGRWYHILLPIVIALCSSENIAQYDLMLHHAPELVRTVTRNKHWKGKEGDSPQFNRLYVPTFRNFVTL